jgi:hypothetical protein
VRAFALVLADYDADKIERFAILEADAPSFIGAGGIEDLRSGVDVHRMCCSGR